MRKLAPILLFTYKRLDTLKLTVKALQENDLARQSKLFIFSDGAKKVEDVEVIEEIRDYIRSIEGFDSVEITESPVNKGLAESIISGVTKIIKLYKKVIVLEDDLKTTKNFLTFMNYALDEFEKQSKVFSISGYSFNLGVDDDSTDSYFLNRGWSWGWSTWEDRWEKVDWNMSDYSDFSVNKLAKREFSKGGSDLNQMLKKQMEGALDSWAIRWFYQQYKVKGLTLFPVLSKIDNNGFDENATHTTGSINRYLPRMDDGSKRSFTYPKTLIVNNYYQKKFRRKMGLFSRLISKLQTVLKMIFNSI